MDPYQKQRNPLDNGTNIPPDSTSDSPPENPSRNAPDRQNQPQYADGFTIITPDMSRRNKLTTIAQKEEEALQKLKETRRAAPVHMNPEKLGGSGTLDEARRRQLTELRCAKLQKRLKKEDADKRRKEEEDEKQQKIKDTQREKAERLALKKQEDEQKRSDQLKPSHLRSHRSVFTHFF